ncbi:MAG TPA: hypothetical protein VGD88_08880 [Opitutaceae bacterium]
MVLWLYSAEQYGNSTPINEIAEHAALSGFNDETVDVLCLHGFEFIPEADRAVMQQRGFLVQDVSALYHSIAGRFPTLRRLHPNHFFECFLRWLVLKEFYAGAPIIAWDADIFLNDKLSRLHAAFAGSTFTSSSTCFAALHDATWLDTYERQLVAYESEPKAYRDGIFNQLKICRQNTPEQFETSFFGPIIARTLDDRAAWDQLFDGTPEEMFVDHLVRTATLPHHLGRPWGDYVICPQPMLLPQLAWHHPFGAGLPQQNRSKSSSPGLSYVEGRYAYNGRPLAFIHFQGALFRACAAHLIQSRFFRQVSALHDELYSDADRRTGLGVNTAFFSRKEEVAKQLSQLVDYRDLSAKWGNPFSERNVARRFLIEPNLAEAMAQFGVGGPESKTNPDPEFSAEFSRKAPICLVCCYLPFDGAMRESWLQLHHEMRSRGLALVMLARHSAPDLPFPVFEIPLSFKEYLDRFPVAAAIANRAGCQGDSELARIDFERWKGQHTFEATLAGVPVARAVFQVYLNHLKPACVLVWDDGPAVSSCLRQLCWEQGVPVQVLERGLLPGTLMIERHGMASYSDLRSAWLADEMELPAGADELYRAAQEFYLRSKPTKYAQPEFGHGAGEWREKIGGAGRRVVVFFGHVDAGTHGTSNSPLGRNGNPAFASTLDALRALAQVVAERNDAVLVFKPHPFDPTDYTKEDLKGGFLLRDANIHALIELADLVAAQFTTIQYEAVFYGKPVLALTRSPWWGRDATYEVNTAESLAETVDAALARRDWMRKESNARSFLTWMLHRFLIAWAPGVPARRGISDFAQYLQRWASDASQLATVGSRLMETITLLANLGYDYASELPCITRERAFHFLDHLGKAGRSKGKPDQTAIWDVTIDGRQDRGIYMQPPVDLTFRVPTGERGRFQSAVCVHPLAWDKPGAGGCEFHLRIDGRVVHVVALDPVNIPADRHWHELNVAVPARADGFHEISIEVRPIGGSNAYRWGIWRAPKFSYVTISAPLNPPITVQ